MWRAKRNIDAGPIQVGSPIAGWGHGAMEQSLNNTTTSSTVFGEKKNNTAYGPSCFQTAMTAVFGTTKRTGNIQASQGNRTATLAIKSYLREYDGDSSALLKAEDLVVGALINAGAEGQVFNATYTGSPVAVKEIHNQHYELSEGFKREFQGLRLIQHPGIIRLYGVVAMQSAATGRNRFLLVMEVAKGSLRDVIDRSMEDATVLTLEKVIGYAIEIAQAMAYVHAQDLLHLDLKPENILIDEDGDIKICDLGLAALCTSTDKTTGIRQRTVSTVGINGTPTYMAPERVAEMRNRATNGQLLDRPGAPMRISTMADVYSFAFVLYEMLHRTRSHPKEWDAYQIIAEVKLRGYRPSIGREVPAMLSKTIRRCWADDPRTRPTFRDVVKRLKKILQEVQTSNSTTSSSRFGGGNSILRGKASSGVVGGGGIRALARLSQMFSRNTSGLGRGPAGSFEGDVKALGGRNKKHQQQQQHHQQQQQQQQQQQRNKKEAPAPPPRNSGPDSSTVNALATTDVPVAAALPPVAALAPYPSSSAVANAKKKNAEVRAPGGGHGHSPKLSKVDSRARAISNSPPNMSKMNTRYSASSSGSNVARHQKQQEKAHDRTHEKGHKSKHSKEHNKQEHSKPGDSRQKKKHG